MRILVVSSDPGETGVVSRLADELLAGAEIVTEPGGAAGCARLGVESFDVVLLDDELPDMTGVQFLDALRSHGIVPPPVIVLSRFNDAAAAAEVLQRGASHILPKNLDLRRTLPVLIRRLTGERALRANVDISDAQYRTLLEETNDGIYILVGNQFIYVNRRFEQMFGYAREQILDPGFNYENLIAEESREMIRDRARRAASGEMLEPRYEFVALNGRGERFDVGVSVSYIEHQGQPATLGLIQDVTERKTFEKALVRRNRELALLNDIAATVNRSLDLGTVLDVAAERLMRVMHLNAAGISLLDQGRKVLGRHVFRGITDVFRRHLREIPLGVGIMGIAAARGEILVVDDVRTDPRVHINEVRGTGFVSAAAVPIKAASRVLGVAVCFCDHRRTFNKEELDLLTHIGNQVGTAVDKAQLYLRLKETVRRMVALDQISRLLGGTLDTREVFALAASQLRRLVACDRVSVAVLDPATDRFDLQFLAVEGVEVEPSKPSVARAHSAMEQAIEAQHAVVLDLANAAGEYELHLKQQGFKTFVAVPIVVERTPVGTLNLTWFEPAAVDDDTLQVLGALAAHLAVAIKNTRLFSELESTVAELRTTQERLLQAGRLEALGELAAGVAHDFNNVLGAILGRAQLLKNYIHDATLAKNIDVIERAALDGAATVRRIQEFSRSQSDVAYEAVSMAAVAREAIEYTQPRWRNRAAREGIRIQVQVDVHEAPLVRGNPQELREVLTNLIHNACDAMPQGGRLQLTVGPCADGAYAEVADTGAGIPRDVIARIYDPFFTTKGSRGSGLGLSVSYGIIQQHKGRIEVHSEPDVGTVFRIELPSCDHVPAPRPEPAPPLPPAKGARILVIDDEMAIREVLADILETGDHHVVLASDGASGIARFGEEEFDLVFTDLGMPGMSGFDVARELKRQRPQVPVGLLTGWGHNVDQEEMSASGIDILVPKPFNVDDVLNLVSQVLHQRNGQQT